MAAKTFEQWWESMEREPLTYSYEHAKEGWNAAIKNIEAVATSHNSAMDEICANTPCVYCDHTVNKCNGCKDYSHFAGRKLRQ